MLYVYTYILDESMQYITTYKYGHNTMFVYCKWLPTQLVMKSRISDRLYHGL